MALTQNSNARKILSTLENFNYTSTLLGALSIITLIFQHGKANGDSSVTFLLGTCFLVGAAGFSVMQLVIATMLSFLYPDKTVTVDKTLKPEFPIILTAPIVMVDLATLQYFAGLVLCHASHLPSWWTVAVVANLSVPFGVAIAIAVKHCRNEFKPKVQDQASE
jgi:hypothetical protein